MGRRRPILVLACFAVAALSGCREVDPDRIPRIPVLPPPPPLPQAALVPRTNPVPVKQGGFYAKVGIGVGSTFRWSRRLCGSRARTAPAPRARVPRPYAPPRAAPLPPSTCDGAQLLHRVLEPRVRMDTLIVETGRHARGAVAVSGAMAVAAAGRGPRGPRRRPRRRAACRPPTLAARRSGSEGRPLTVESVPRPRRSEPRRRRRGRRRDLGLTLLSATSPPIGRTAGQATIDADTFARGLHAFFPDLPEEGTGAGVVVLRGEGLEDAPSSSG